MKKAVISIVSISFLLFFVQISFAEEVSSSGLAKVDYRKEVSQYGITWTFDKPAKTGRFITGDWWVVGPVTIVKITPAPGLCGLTVRRLKLTTGMTQA